MALSTYRFPQMVKRLRLLEQMESADEHGTSVLERALKNQVGAAREKLGRNACSTFLIVDAQSVKNADTAGFKGYDAGKKVSASSVTLQWTALVCRMRWQ